jgi:uncharacterized protein with FMN-binding domain
MRRAPIVISATVAGVASVLSFQTHALSQPAVTTPTVASGSGSTTPSTKTKTKTSTTGKASTSTGTKTATGSVATNQYGAVQVKVTVSGGKIASITALQLPASDPKSAQISQFAGPQLQSEALAAQSAKINGVSGASYTSQSYETSLQSALDQVGYTA